MVLTLDQAVEKRAGAADKRIAAACGCFDVFHIGHLEYLQGASGFADLLFVGVNSDDSVFHNKGRAPVFSCSDRLELLSGLRCVDFVFPFEESSFARVLSVLRPDVFARGSDAGVKTFPEKEVVHKLGISVVIVGQEKRASSSHLRYILEEKRT